MTGGMALKWFKDQFCAAEQSLAKERGLPVYRLLDELAEQSPPLSNGVLTLPYFNGTLQPQFNPAARGVFFGVGLENTRADFVRSILESVAYMLRENIEMIAALGGGAPSRLHCCGGGSRSSVWNQIKADVLGLNAYELTCSETTSIGAAALSLLPKYGEAGVVSLLEQTTRSGGSTCLTRKPARHTGPAMRVIWICTSLSRAYSDGASKQRRGPLRPGGG